MLDEDRAQEGLDPARPRADGQSAGETGLQGACRTAPAREAPEPATDEDGADEEVGMRRCCGCACGGVVVGFSRTWLCPRATEAQPMPSSGTPRCGMVTDRVRPLSRPHLASSPVHTFTELFTGVSFPS